MKSEAKAKSSKQNAQKAGRHYEYVIIGYQDGKRVVLGLGKSRKKEKLFNDCMDMFVDCQSIELILSTKATQEDIEAAKKGTYISPSCIIV